MGTSLYDSYLKEQQTRPAPGGSLYAQFQAEHAAPAADPNQKLHDEFKSGRLAGRMARENANDAEDAATPEPGYGERLATHLLNAAQGIPGVRAVEAGAGALGSQFTKQPMNYRQSLATLDGATKHIGGVTSFAEKAMGGLATAPFLPASPVAAGAVLGGADQALDANPDESKWVRAGKTVAGAGVGAVVGGLADRAVTGVRAGLAPNSAKNVLARKAERSGDAAVNYADAVNNAHPATPAVHSYLAQPDIADIVDGLRQTRPFQNVAPDDPKMLDAVFKVLSDQEGSAKRGLEVPVPNKPNLGRFKQENIGMAKSDFLNAVEAPAAPGAGAPAGMMPKYRNAVDTYATQSRGIDAVRKGQDAIRTATGQIQATGKNLDRTTPEAFAEWAKTASPDEIAAVKQGILGGTKAAFGRPGKTLLPGRTALPNASSLIRAVDPNDFGSLLTRLGIAGVNGGVGTP